MTREEKITAIREVADEVGGTIRDSYSGRGMYGKTCYGIVCDDPTMCIEAAAERGIRGSSRDSMGKDYIVYWTSVSGARE